MQHQVRSAESRLKSNFHSQAIRYITESLFFSTPFSVIIKSNRIGLSLDCLLNASKLSLTLSRVYLGLVSGILYQPLLGIFASIFCTDPAIPYCRLSLSEKTAQIGVGTPSLIFLILIVLFARLIFFDHQPVSPLVTARAHSRLDFLFALYKTILGVTFPIVTPLYPLIHGIYLLVGSLIFFLLRLHWLPYFRLWMNQIQISTASFGLSQIF